MSGSDDSAELDEPVDCALLNGGSSALLGLLTRMQGTCAPGACPPGSDRLAFEAAIAATAVKHPRDQVPLDRIDPAQATVEVVTFSTHRPDEKKNRGRDIWVALPESLRRACAGAADPVRRLQQVLGLRADGAEDRKLFVLQMPRDALFRPCVGGGDLEATECSTDVPEPLPPDDAASAPKAAASAPPAARKLREEYDRMQFLAAQMWRSYRSGFSSSPGYPFTGMGWTYDWSNPEHPVGVSEFVVRRDAAITVVDARTQTPAQFCAAGGQAQR